MSRKDGHPPEPGAVLRRADDFRPGDRVVFRMPGAGYVIDEVDTSPIGQLRHHHGDWTASSCYHPGEMLWCAPKVAEGWVERPRRGRPRLPPELARHDRVEIRLTRAQREALTRLGGPDWIRTMIDRASRLETPRLDRRPKPSNT